MHFRLVVVWTICRTSIKIQCDRLFYTKVGERWKNYEVIVYTGKVVNQTCWCDIKHLEISNDLYASPTLHICNWMKLSSLFLALDLFYSAHECAKLEAYFLNFPAILCKLFFNCKFFSAAQNQRLYWEPKPITASSYFSLI